MKRFRHIFAVLAAAVLLAPMTACSDDDEPEVADTLAMSFREGAKVASSAGSMFIIVESNQSWTLGIDFDDLEPWAELGQTSGTGNKYLSLMWDKNTGTIDRNLTVVLSNVPEDETTLPDTVKLVFTQTSAENDPIEGGDIVNTDVPGWMEIPEVSSSEQYIAHSFNLNGSVLRNFSMGWNQSALVANWVAYPLSKIYTSGSVGRTDQWAYDPYLGAEKSPAPF
ncbi:MAG: hypothetical protein K5984_02540, partial [Bacteroidales bacterium]|nr:hypothetical protein [Bacteroidales bacterium]